MKLCQYVLFSSLAMVLAGCNSLAGKTNMLDDDKIKSQTGGTLGYDPSEITVVSRRTEGTNTYVLIKTKDSKQFNCIINGGNLLTLGMTNPPQCAPKGQTIKSGPFGS
ncbi:hypothetical protein ACVNP3_26185 [Pseudomonas chlororaphis subsp. piscium]